MAPIDVMPHAVLFFLEQVHKKLWDGRPFISREASLLQVGRKVKRKKKPLLKAPVEESDDSMSFQEYDDRFPHNKYTLGFSGRPSGDSFYLNMKDNSASHAPWGELNDLHNDADPCFAKVVSGFEVVEKIFALPTDRASKIFQEMAQIRSATIL